VLLVDDTFAEMTPRLRAEAPTRSARPHPAVDDEVDRTHASVGEQKVGGIDDLGGGDQPAQRGARDGGVIALIPPAAAVSDHAGVLPGCKALIRIGASSSARVRTKPVTPALNVVTMVEPG
jgi:hypothetical protein